MASTRPRARRTPGAAATPAPTPRPVVGGLPLGEALDGARTPPQALAMPHVTLEAAIYTLAVAVALLLRFWRLGDMALSRAEAQSALASLDIVRGGQLPSDAGALLGFGNALVFAIAGATDASARFLPALIGGLIPLAMMWARPLIGRGPAVIAAVLLAFSPLLLDASRGVDSSGMAATLSLAVGWAVFDYARARRPIRLLQAAFFLALTLTAGIGAVSALMALAVVGLIGLMRLAQRRRLPGDVDGALTALAPVNGHSPEPIPGTVEVRGRATVLRAIGLFLGTLFVVSTGALTNVGGVGAGLFAPIGAWLSGPAGGGQASAWTAPLALLAYEPLALVLGAIGAVQAFRRGRAVDLFLVLWMALGCLAALVSPDRSPVLLATAIVPATVLAAAVAHRLAAAVAPDAVVDYLIALVVLVWGFSIIVLGFGHVSQPDPVGVRYVSPVLAPLVGRASSDQAALLFLAILPIVLTCLGLSYLWRRTPPSARLTIPAAAATLLLGLTVHAGWNLAYQANGNAAEIPRSHQSSVDLRALADDVDSLRQVLTINRKEKTLVVDASERIPLAWYLRGGDTRFEARPSGSPALLVVPADQKAPAGKYVGQRYRVGLAGNLRFENAAQLWRWLIYRESPVPPVGEDVMLFVKGQ